MTTTNPAWHVHLNDLRRRIDALREDRGVTDTEIAHALYDLIQEQPVSQPALAQSEEGALMLSMLRWWMFVRAPSLRSSYIVLSPMSLDLMLSASRSIDEMLDDLATLEQAAGEGVERESAAPEEAQELVSRMRSYGEIPEHFEDVTRDDFDRLSSLALEAMSDHAQAYDVLTGSVMNELFDEFGQLGRTGTWQAILQESSIEDTQSLTLDQDADEIVSQGYTHYEQGEFDRALRAYNRVLASEPYHVEALIGRGVVQAAAGQIVDALRDLDRAIASRPDHMEALLNRGLARYASGELDGALQDFDRALELEGAPGEAWLNRANVRAQLGDMDGAMRDVERAVEAMPESSRPIVDRALLRRHMGDVQGAMSDYSEAIARDDEDADAWAGRGALRLEFGGATVAEGDLRRATQLQPWRAPLHYNLGNALAMQDRIAEAITCYSEAIALDDQDVDALINRGTAYLKLEQTHRALEDWDRAIRLDPYRPDPYLRRGAVLLLSGEPEYAAQDFDRALEVAPPEWPMRARTIAQRDQARAQSEEGGERE